MSELPILYLDEHYVAVHKPAGLLFHRTGRAPDEEALLQRLRDQIGRYLYPIHRLDRPTSGVVLFGLSSEAARRAGAVFTERRVEKVYRAVARGWTELEGSIDIALVEEEGRAPQPALTDYRRLATTELPIPVGPYETARYSLVGIRPRTGRMHQIRKHFNYIAHPLVGDVAHGDHRHNRMFKERFGIERLLLTAIRLSLIHPYSGALLVIEAAPEAELDELFRTLGWEDWIGSQTRSTPHPASPAIAPAPAPALCRPTALQP
ncbi:MAG TPA: pseudouridine synthase [Candidatus Competibacteraceae bacterium]|nr:pseudouridine synthase [Candidatus Competibacteraceae bacterium]